MGDESGEQKDQGERSQPPAKSEETLENGPDNPMPFFLNDDSSNMAGHHLMHLHRAHRAAASLSGSGALTPLALRAEAPSLLLQTVIVAGDRTNEGRLIEAVTLPWFDIIALLEKDFSIAYKIPPDKWEELIAGTYKAAGFDQVTLTPRSGDHGRDVIAIKKGVGFIRVIDQVKAYKPLHRVKASEVNALIGVLHGDGASKGFLTTTSDFAPRIATNPTIIPFIPSRLELINGAKLQARLAELAQHLKSGNLGGALPSGD
jgi:restriction system protein